VASVVPASRERSFFEVGLERELRGWMPRRLRSSLKGSQVRREPNYEALCCLTIASEGRETWAAWSLRVWGDSAGLAWVFEDLGWFGGHRFGEGT